MGACCCCYSRTDDYNEDVSGCCCARYCCPSCIGCFCGMCAPTAEEHDSSSSVQDMRYLRTPCDGPVMRHDKSGPVQSRESQLLRESTGEGEGEALAAFQNLKSADFNSQVMDSKPGSPGTCQPSKVIESVVPLTDEEDVCPTCLEGYDKGNPRIVTKCEHHFHLACILEWMERSDSCPICDQEMIFNETP